MREYKRDEDDSSSFFTVSPFDFQILFRKAKKIVVALVRHTVGHEKRTVC